MKKVEKRPLAVALGRKLKAHREAAQLTQQSAAERIQRSYDSITGWEQGSSIPELGALMLLAEVYGCRVEDLLPDYSLARMEPVRRRLARTGPSTHPRALGAKRRRVTTAPSSSRRDGAKHGSGPARRAA